MRILAFSDLHGNTEVLESLIQHVKNESFDFLLIAGDLTNADLIKPEETVRQAKEIFRLLEDLKIPYYFIWGLPNREFRIVASLKFVRMKKTGVRVVEKGDYAELVEESKRVRMRIPKSRVSMGENLEALLSSLVHGRCLNDVKMADIGSYKLTCDPKLADRNTILLTHCYRKPSNALIHLDGHVHYGQKHENYLNLGFLHRGEAHGATSLTGCYWTLELQGREVSIRWIDSGNELKEYTCPVHPEEGTFYVPHYWKRCPVCYNPQQAIFGSPQ